MGQQTAEDAKLKLMTYSPVDYMAGTPNRFLNAKLGYWKPKSTKQRKGALDTLIVQRVPETLN